MTVREGLPEQSEEDRDFYRWYGAWDPLTPAEVAARLAGLAARWWIVGGWAVDAFTGSPRVHEDIDVAFFRADLPAVLAQLSPDLCVWSNLGGTLRPLRKAEDLLDGARQLWVRRDGQSPWLMDLAMTPHDGDTWISPRDERIRRAFDEATFVAADGIRYLQPELVLFMKARVTRASGRARLRHSPAAARAGAAGLVARGRRARPPGPPLAGPAQGVGATGIGVSGISGTGNGAAGIGASDRSTLPARKSRISSR